MSLPNYCNVQSSCEVIIERCTMKEKPMEHSHYDNKASGTRNELVLAQNVPMDRIEDFMEEEYSALAPQKFNREQLQNGFPDHQISNCQHQPVEDLDQQKIQFAAVLKLMPKNTTPISSEPLSKIELSYIDKCKAIVDMNRTFVCACHNVPHQNLRGLLSHLRASPTWFPLFTCYNCMITFANRSAYTRHIERCSCLSLYSLTKLSNLRRRSEVKTRLYQNFRCTACKITFSFHEDFRRHVDDKHSPIKFPFHCRCRKFFYNIEDYQKHVYTSCLVIYHCDVCSSTTITVDDFQVHARNVHDNSEGFTLLQDDDHSMTKQLIHDKEVEDGTLVTEKRGERAFVGASTTDTISFNNTLSVVNPDSLSPGSRNKTCPICSKQYSTFRNMKRHYKVHNMTKSLLHEEEREHRKWDRNTTRMNNSVPILSKFETKCPTCFKEFSTNYNMRRHQKVHLEKQKVAKTERNEALDSASMYNSDDRQNHLAEKHASHICGECGDSFQFHSELDQHKCIHLSLKVYRDPKTQSYESTAISISPGYKHESKMESEVTLINLQLSNSSLDASVELSACSDEKMLECRLPELATRSCLSDHRKKIQFVREIPFPGSSFHMRYNYCDSIGTGAANHNHNIIQEKTNPSITEIGIKNKLLAGDNMCKMCSKVFSSKKTLENHMKCHGMEISPIPKKQIERTPTSSICQKVCSTTKEVDSHQEALHHGNDRFTPTKATEAAVQFVGESKPSKYCEIPLDSIVSLTKHVHEEHNDNGKTKIDEAEPEAKYFSCNVCTKCFQTAGALASHLGWHKRGRNESTVKLIRRNTNSYHGAQMRQSVDELKFQCVTCSAELSDDTALQVHILAEHRIIDDIMLISRCNACNMDFNTLDEYDNHQGVHDILQSQRQQEHGQVVPLDVMGQDNEVSKPNISESPKITRKIRCSTGFSKSDTLAAHVRKTEFKCTQCDSTFTKLSSLTIHLKVHDKHRVAKRSTRKSMLSCSVCNMRFDLPNHLLAHVISAHPF